MVELATLVYREFLPLRVCMGRKLTHPFELAPERREDFRLPGVSVASAVPTPGPSRASSLTTSREPSLVPPAGLKSHASRATSRIHTSAAKEKSKDVSSVAEPDADTFSSDSDEDDEPRPWDTDSRLNDTDRALIIAEKSHYAKTKAYNTIRNKYVLKEMHLDTMVQNLFKETAPTQQTRSPCRSSHEASKPNTSQAASTSPQQRRPLSLDSPSHSPLYRQKPSASGLPTSPSRPKSPRLPISPSRSKSPHLPSSPTVSLSAPPSPDANAVQASSSARDSSTALSQVQLKEFSSLAMLRPSLADTHPASNRWPAWMTTIIRAMERVSPSCKVLSEAMEDWVQFENLMEYPDSKVRLPQFLLFSFANSCSRRKNIYSTARNSPPSSRAGSERHANRMICQT